MVSSMQTNTLGLIIKQYLEKNIDAHRVSNLNVQTAAPVAVSYATPTSEILSSRELIY